MRKLVVIAALVLVGLVSNFEFGQRVEPSSSTPSRPAVDNAAVARAFADRASDVQLQGQGTVIKVLPDDTRGSVQGLV